MIPFSFAWSLIRIGHHGLFGLVYWLLHFKCKSGVTYLSQFIFIFGIKFVCLHFGIELNQYVLAFLTIIGTFILYLLLDSLEKRYPFKIFRCAF